MVDDKLIADTKLIVVEPNKLNYNSLGEIYLDVTENLMNSSGLVYIAIDSSSNYLEEDIENFYNRIMEMSKRYSGIRIKKFTNNNLINEIKNWLEN